MLSINIHRTKSFQHYRQNVLLVLHPLDTGDEPEEEVHHGGGGQVGEEQLRELWLGLDVLYDLETGVLVAVPVLNITTTFRHRATTRETWSQQPLYLLRSPRDQHPEGFAEEAGQERVEWGRGLQKCVQFVQQGSVG